MVPDEPQTEGPIQNERIATLDIPFLYNGHSDLAVYPKSVIRKICFLFVIFLLFLQQKSSAEQYN